MLTSGAVACLKSRCKGQAGEKILDFTQKLIIKRKEEKPHQLSRTMCCCLRLEENKMTVLSLREMLRAKRCPMAKRLIYLERTCPCDLVTHRSSSLFRITYIKGTLLKDFLSSDVV